MATERPCACKPSLSASAIAAGPITRRDSGVHLRMDVRFMKSSTPRPEENFAERALVGDDSLQTGSCCGRQPQVIRRSFEDLLFNAGRESIRPGIGRLPC